MSKFGNYLRTKAMKRRAKEERKKNNIKKVNYDSMSELSSGIEK